MPESCPYQGPHRQSKINALWASLARSMDCSLRNCGEEEEESAHGRYGGLLPFPHPHLREAPQTSSPPTPPADGSEVQKYCRPGCNGREEKRRASYTSKRPLKPTRPRRLQARNNKDPRMRKPATRPRPAKAGKSTADDQQAKEGTLSGAQHYKAEDEPKQRWCTSTRRAKNGQGRGKSRGRKRLGRKGRKR